MGLVIATLAAVLLLAAVTAPDIWAQDDKVETEMVPQISGPVTIGGLFSSTGDMGSLDDEVRAALNLGIADFNAYLAGQGAEWQLEMVSEDTATNPEVAHDGIQTLHKKGITTVLGPVTSANVGAVREYVSQNDMLALSCCSSAPSLAVPGDGVYRLVPDDSGQGLALGKLLTENGIEALVPIWRADAYGDGVWKAVVDDVEARGGTVYAGVRYSPYTPEMSLEVALLEKYVREAIILHGVDKVAVIMISFEESSKIARAASGYDVLDDVRWFASESTTLGGSLTMDTAAAEFSESVEMTAVGILLEHGRQYEYVDGALTEELGFKPSIVAHVVYDSVWMVGMAMIEAGSAEASDIRMALPATITGYDGALQYAGLNEAGDLLPTAHHILMLVDGAWIEVGTYMAKSDMLLLD